MITAPTPAAPTGSGGGATRHDLRKRQISSEDPEQDRAGVGEAAEEEHGGDDLRLVGAVGDRQEREV